jgi:hypothetical protein
MPTRARVAASNTLLANSLYCQLRGFAQQHSIEPVGYGTVLKGNMTIRMRIREERATTNPAKNNDSHASSSLKG